MYHSSDRDVPQNLGIVMRGSNGRRLRTMPAKPRPSSPTLDDPPRIMKNQYAYCNVLGKGKIGKVFRCKDLNNSTYVAVKIVAKNVPIDKIQLLRRNNPIHQNMPLNTNTTLSTIRKEALLLRKCCHLNIVSFVELIDDPQDGNIYLVMENLDGGPVQWQDKKTGGPILTLPQIRRIMRDVILGLEYLHHEGIIHRDVKPQNIVWNESRGFAKLIDFGIAHYSSTTHELASYSSRHGNGKQVERSDSIDPWLFPESDLRRTIGTPAFLAPEVVWTDVTSGRIPITNSVDIWSLGVTLYCLLFARLPFDPEVGENSTAQHHEYKLYETIGTATWDLDEVMGVEGIPTQDDDSDDADEPSQGTLVIHLLDGMLQKKPGNRILLPYVKAHPWIIQDITNGEEWLRLTSPSTDITHTEEQLPEETKSPSKEAIKSPSNWVKSTSQKFKKFMAKKG